LMSVKYLKLCHGTECGVLIKHSWRCLQYNLIWTFYLCNLIPYVHSPTEHFKNPSCQEWMLHTYIHTHISFNIKLKLI
jgi:hypothetical protein